LKRAILPKAMYRFNTIPIKIPIPFFAEIEKSILKLMQKNKRLRRAKAILSKKGNARGKQYPTSKEKQCVTGTKRDTKTNEANRRTRNKSTQL
jgi:hypothetical protein